MIDAEFLPSGGPEGGIDLAGAAWPGASSLSSGRRPGSTARFSPSRPTQPPDYWLATGVLWPVVHQQLGVDPQLGAGLLEVLPAVPPGQASVSGTNIRVSTGSVDVTASHHGASWTTTVTARLACTLHAGATLPGGAKIRQVTLNGVPVPYTVRDTNAGRQVLVDTPCGGRTWRVHISAT